MPTPDTPHAPAVIDIAGTELTSDDRRRLAHPLVGGLILFTRNWEGRRQLGALTAEIRAMRPDVLICVDHEGGRVQRFKTDGFTALPPMRAFGDYWMSDAGPTNAHMSASTGHGAMRALDAATACGFVLAAELRACGVDFSFTPVLDLDHGPSGVIGNRAFHRDPRVVAALARALILGLLQAGMAHCGKHFPGHGYASADSHVAMPVDRRTLDVLLSDDAQPYAWLGSALQAVMPAHVIYPNVDARPAGFSARWLKDILRGQLGFGGAIFSDDLSMAGARRAADMHGGREMSFTEAAVAALNAGCDLVLLCNQSMGDGRAVDDWLDGLATAAQRGQWQPNAQSEQRRLSLRPRGPAIDWRSLQRSADYVRAARTVGAVATIGTMGHLTRLP